MEQIFTEIIYVPLSSRVTLYIYTRDRSSGSLPLAVLFLVRAAVLAARAENVHYLGYEACKHRLETKRETASKALELSTVS